MARCVLRRRHVNAAVEDALVAFCGTRGPAPSDAALWATFAWRFGYGWLNELAARGKSEMRMHKGGVAPAERPRILQNLLNEVWHARFSKKEPASAEATARQGGCGMKDRMTLGHDADVAETAALTLADGNAERRMFDELDRETDRKVEGGRIVAALRRLERNLGPEMRSFARKVLNGKGWREIGMSKSTFHDTLKKVEKFFRP